MPQGSLTTNFFTITGLERIKWRRYGTTAEPVAEDEPCDGMDVDTIQGDSTDQAILSAAPNLDPLLLAYVRLLHDGWPAVWCATSPDHSERELYAFECLNNASFDKTAASLSSLTKIVRKRRRLRLQQIGEGEWEIHNTSAPEGEYITHLLFEALTNKLGWSLAAHSFVPVGRGVFVRLPPSLSASSKHTLDDSDASFSLRISFFLQPPHLCLHTHVSRRRIAALPASLASSATALSLAVRLCPRGTPAVALVDSPLPALSNPSAADDKPWHTLFNLPCTQPPSRPIHVRFRRNRIPAVATAAIDSDRQPHGTVHKPQLSGTHGRCNAVVPSRFVLAVIPSNGTAVSTWATRGVPELESLHAVYKLMADSAVATATSPTAAASSTTTAASALAATAKVDMSTSPAPHTLSPKRAAKRKRDDTELSTSHVDTLLSTTAKRIKLDDGTAAAPSLASSAVSVAVSTLPAAIPHAAAPLSTSSTATAPAAATDMSATAAPPSASDDGLRLGDFSDVDFTEWMRTMDGPAAAVSAVLTSSSAAAPSSPPPPPVTYTPVSPPTESDHTISTMSTSRSSAAATVNGVRPYVVPLAYQKIDRYGPLPGVAAVVSTTSTNALFTYVPTAAVMNSLISKTVNYSPTPPPMPAVFAPMNATDSVSTSTFPSPQSSSSTTNSPSVPTVTVTPAVPKASIVTDKPTALSDGSDGSSESEDHSGHAAADSDGDSDTGDVSSDGDSDDNAAAEAGADVAMSTDSSSSSDEAECDNKYGRPRRRRRQRTVDRDDVSSGEDDDVSSDADAIGGLRYGAGNTLNTGRSVNGLPVATAADGEALSSAEMALLETAAAFSEKRSGQRWPRKRSAATERVAMVDTRMTKHSAPAASAAGPLTLSDDLVEYLKLMAIAPYDTAPDGECPLIDKKLPSVAVPSAGSGDDVILDMPLPASDAARFVATLVEPLLMSTLATPPRPDVVRRGGLDGAAEVPLPRVLVGTVKKGRMRVLPTLLPYWEKVFGVAPYSPKKDIAYYVLCPDTEPLRAAVGEFFRDLSTVYQTCNLGDHVGAVSTVADQFTENCVWVASPASVEAYVAACQTLCRQLETHGRTAAVSQLGGCTVVYVVDAFGGSLNGAALRKLLRAVTPLLTASVSTLSTHRPVVQTVPANHVLQLACQRLPLVKDLAFAIFSKCRSRPPPAAPALQPFEPLYVLSDVATPTGLAAPVYTMHCVYCQADERGQRWVVVATDRRGELLESSVVDVAMATDGDRTELVAAVWRFVVGLTGFYRPPSPSPRRWRVVLARLGPMPPSEHAAWHAVAMDAAGAADVVAEVAVVSLGVHSCLQLFTAAMPQSVRAFAYCSTNAWQYVQCAAGGGPKSTPCVAMATGVLAESAAPLTVGQAAVGDIAGNGNAADGVSPTLTPLMVQVCLHRQLALSESNMPPPPPPLDGLGMRMLVLGILSEYHGLSWLNTSVRTPIRTSLLPLHCAVARRLAYLVAMATGG